MNNRAFLHHHWKKMEESFQLFSKLGDIRCPEGCSSCCEEHQPTTSIFEMLPMAEQLFQQGKMEYYFERIEDFSEKRCALIENHQCQAYENRPSLCRLFGLGRVENKNETNKTPRFSICKIIQQQNPEKIKSLPNIKELQEIKTHNQLHLPILMQIPAAEAEELPINQALKRALEKVAFYSSYSRKE